MRYIIIPTFLLASLLLFPLVNAIGVSPGSIRLTLSPGDSANPIFMVHRTSQSTISASVSLQADNILEPFVDYPSTISFSDSNLQEVPVSIRYPSGIDRGGPLTFYLQFTENFKPQEGTISAKAAIRVPIRLFIQFAGKYAVASFRAEDVVKDQSVPMEITVTNAGTAVINNAVANIDVYDTNNQKIGTVQTNTVSNIQPLGKAVLKASWDSSGFDKGNYWAAAHIDYDGAKIELNDTFRIGELNVILHDAAGELPQNSFASYWVKVENEWNDPLENLFADITVLNGSRKVASFSVSDRQIKAWETKNIKGLVDTNGFPTGTFDASVSLSFNEIGKTEKHTVTGTFPLTITEKAPEPVKKPVEPPKEAPAKSEQPAGISSTTLLIIGGLAILIVLLIVFNIFVIAAFRRKKDDKKEEENKEL